jgi:hypothetical protein
MNEHQNKAIEKIGTELKTFTGGQKEKVVSDFVSNTLCEFCKQEIEFAEAIVQTSKTLSDCCKEIMKSTGGSISDLETYRRAVNFYFPGAGIDFVMKINLCAAGEVDHVEKGKTLEFSLDDLLEI